MATKKNNRSNPARRGRAMAQENPPASRTATGNGGDGNGSNTASVTDVPELTAEQRQQLAEQRARKSPNRGRGNAGQYNSRREDPSPVPTIMELLTQRLSGVGKTTAEAALADTGKDGAKKAPPEMRNRANIAPKEKAGLRGKALALWVLTGNSNGGQRSERPADEPASRRQRTAGLDGTAGQEQLIAYLKAQVSGDAMAPASQLPTVDEHGKLRLKSAHWRAWLASRGIEVGANAAVKVLREAGLDQERWFSLPRGQRMCYVGRVPAGAGKLPVRKDTPLPGATQPGQRRAAGQRPFARPSVEQIDVLTDALTRYKPRSDAAKQVRDELLALLKA